MSVASTKSPIVCSLYTGSDDPSVTPTDGFTGDLYSRKFAGGVALYQKQDNGLTANWDRLIDSSSTQIPLTVGFLTSTGGRNKHTREIVATPDVPSLTLDHILLSAVGAATAINLPAGLTGAEFEIKDSNGDAAVNNITITPNGAETIDGAANYVINANFGSVRLIFYNGDWKVMA